MKAQVTQVTQQTALITTLKKLVKKNLKETAVGETYRKILNDEKFLNLGWDKTPAEILTTLEEKTHEIKNLHGSLVRTLHLPVQLTVEEKRINKILMQILKEARKDPKKAIKTANGNIEGLAGKKSMDGLKAKRLHNGAKRK